MASVGKLMMMLAPIVMGALGKAQRQENMNTSRLAGYLSQESQTLERQAPVAGNLLGQLLDSDGDGDFDLQDAAKKGAGLLGKILGGR